MRIFERVVESKGAPSKQDLWVKPVGKGYGIYIHSRGRWVPVTGVSGGGDVRSSETVVVPMRDEDKVSGAYYAGLADILEALRDGTFSGGMVVKDNDSRPGVTGNLYSYIDEASYAEGGGAVQASFSSGNVATNINDDTPDMLRWLSSVSGVIGEITGGYYPVQKFGRIIQSLNMAPFPNPIWMYLADFEGNELNQHGHVLVDGNGDAYDFVVNGDGVIESIGVADVPSTDYGLLELPKSDIMALVGKTMYLKPVH